MPKVDFMDCSNNLRCWECTQDCEIKILFMLPLEVFNFHLLESLKTSAGMYMASGGSFQEADSFVKETAVALSISRQEFLKRIIKDD